MVLSNERTGPDKTTNCSVVFWKLDPSLHFQPVFHPLCLWQHKGACSGNFSSGSHGSVHCHWAGERGRKTKHKGKRKAGTRTTPLHLTLKSQIAFSYLPKAEIFPEFGHTWELPNGGLSLRKYHSFSHLHSFCQTWLQTIPTYVANINVNHGHF